MVLLRYKACTGWKGWDLFGEDCGLIRLGYPYEMLWEALIL